MINNEENTILHIVFRKLEQINRGTIKQIALACQMTDAQVTTAVDRLIALRKAHVNGWNHTETSRSPVRVIKLGRGVNASRERKSDEHDTSLYDVKLKMSEHRKWLATFVPHPDPAAAWLFNEPKVELLGANYERTT